VTPTHHALHIEACHCVGTTLVCAQAEFVITLFEQHKFPSKSSSSNSGGSGKSDSADGDRGSDGGSGGGGGRSPSGGSLGGGAQEVGTATSTDIAEGGFGVKYLTKKTILALQLRDAHVQRQVLLQVGTLVGRDEEGVVTAREGEEEAAEGGRGPACGRCCGGP
jgi:hypothetical protein